MTTYAKISSHVKAAHHFTPKTCWIAHVKFDHGLTRGVSPNSLSLNARKHPCPPNRRTAIEGALAHFGLI